MMFGPHEPGQSKQPFDYWDRWLWGARNVDLWNLWGEYAMFADLLEEV